MRTGSGPIADPDQREGEDGEADEEDDDDYEAPVVGFPESGSGSRSFQITRGFCGSYPVLLASNQ